MKKTVVITGANRGLGKAFVDALMKEEDCFVISISRSMSAAQKEYPSKRFFFLQIDLSENTIGEKMEVLKDIIGNEAIYFINNASIIEPIAKIAELQEAAIDKTISVNIKSSIVLTQYFLKNFNTNALTFVNISSGAANSAIRNWSLYCLSKASIQMFFKVAESEYKQHRFFNIDPGVMDTGMQKSVRESDFPDLENFKELEKEGQLKAPTMVAKDILKTIGVIG
jgi:benzil reductase ((S)-benzoin forming)